MKLCDLYLRRPESHYAAVLDMIGGKKGRRTIVSCDRKDAVSLFCCFEFIRHGSHVSVLSWLTFLQVMFPSGARVLIQRASWGIDVTVYTPRVPTQESGLCIFPPSGQDHNTYGESLRY